MEKKKFFDEEKIFILFFFRILINFHIPFLKLSKTFSNFIKLISFLDKLT
jgi:hypothetical protein